MLRASVFPAVKGKSALADTVGAAADKRAQIPAAIFIFGYAVISQHDINRITCSVGYSEKRNNPAVSEHADFNSGSLKGCKLHLFTR